MPVLVTTYLTFFAAAVAEIAGCFAFWAWLRGGQSVWWALPGIVSLMIFAWLLTLVPSDYAGRTYAAYGGIYIATSLAWLWMAEDQQPDAWDIAGGALAIIAAGIIIFAPRGA